MVEQFNDLIREGYVRGSRDCRQERLAKWPRTELATLMFQNSRTRRRQEEYVSIRSRKEEGFIGGMNAVDEASIFPDDARPYVMPDATNLEAAYRVPQGSRSADR